MNQQAIGTGLEDTTKELEDVEFRRRFDAKLAQERLVHETKERLAKQVLDALKPKRPLIDQKPRIELPPLPGTNSDCGI